MQVTVEALPARRLATLSHRGPYNQIGKAFEQLGALAAPAGLFAFPDAAMVAMYHDDPESVAPQELRSEACLVVPDGLALPPGLGEARIPAGTYARHVYIGPFEGLGDAWSRFMGEWLPQSGHRVGDGPAYEFYVSDMRTTPKEQLRTDLVVPLAPAE